MLLERVCWFYIYVMLPLWHNKLWLIHSLTKKNNFIIIVKNLEASLPNVFEFCPNFWQIKLLRLCFHPLHTQLLIHCSEELNHKICFDKIDNSLKTIIEKFYLWLLLTTYWKVHLLNFKTKRTVVRPTSGFKNLLVSSERNERKIQIWGILKIQIIKKHILISCILNQTSYVKYQNCTKSPRFARVNRCGGNPRNCKLLD